MLMTSLRRCCFVLLLLGIFCGRTSAAPGDDLCTLLQKWHQAFNDYHDAMLGNEPQAVTDDLWDTYYDLFNELSVYAQGLGKHSHDLYDQFTAAEYAASEAEKLYQSAKESAQQNPGNPAAAAIQATLFQAWAEAAKVAAELEKAVFEDDGARLLKHISDQFNRYDNLRAYLELYRQRAAAGQEDQTTGLLRWIQLLRGIVDFYERILEDRFCKEEMASEKPQLFSFFPMEILTEATEEFVPITLSPSRPDESGLVGFNPLPKKPETSWLGASTALGRDREQQEFWGQVVGLSEEPATKQFVEMEPIRRWMSRSDPRMVRHVWGQAVSLGAALNAMSFEGAVNRNQSWVPLAQEGLSVALGQPAEGDGHVAQVASEANLLLRAAVARQLIHFDATGAVPLSLLTQPAAPPRQEGAAFAKVKAQNTQGAPVPGATFTFLVQTETPDGTSTQTQQIAEADEQGEVAIVFSDKPPETTQTGEVAVPEDSTIVGVVTTGSAGETLLTPQTAADVPDETSTAVVGVQETPETKVTFALPRQPDEQMAEVMDEVYGVLARQLKTEDLPDLPDQEQIIAQLQQATADQARSMPPEDTDRGELPRPSTLHVAKAEVLAVPGNDSGALFPATPESYSAQLGVDPASDSSPSRRQEVILWTIPLPPLSGLGGAPIGPEAIATAVQAVSDHGAVLFGEIASPRSAEVLTPNDPYFTSRGSWGQRHADQWALHQIGFKPSSDETTGSAWRDGMAANRYALSPVTVAVIGSGVDYTHADLMTRMWTNPFETLNGKDDDDNGYIDDVFGWNFRDNNRNVMDYGGHDTHIAGIIAAEWNNGFGIAGINPAARIMALKVADMFGQSDSAAISEAIYYAVREGARVINLSYSGEQASRLELEAIRYAAERGVLVVVAAGNQAGDNSQRAVAGYPGVLTVASTSVAAERAGFSNWGQPVQLAAPGLDILSLRARNTDFLQYIGDNPNYDAGSAIVGESQTLYRAGGTSFSAPFVSGVASLIWSMNPTLTLDQVRRKLIMSADDIDVDGWDQNTGAGLLNARKALLADPDHYLYARITRVVPGPVQAGVASVEVSGLAVGSEIVSAELQIAFGADVNDDQWRTIKVVEAPVVGRIAVIPLQQFDRRGTWNIRLVVRDPQRVRESRAQLNLQ